MRRAKEINEGSRLGIALDVPPGSDGDALKEHLEILGEAFAIYAERNIRYKDNWKRMGWRGMLIRVRERSERLWDMLWDREPGPMIDVDDALDLINFAVFLIRAARADNRDGEWWSSPLNQVLLCGATFITTGGCLEPYRCELAEGHSGVHKTSIGTTSVSWW